MRVNASVAYNFTVGEAVRSLLSDTNIVLRGRTIASQLVLHTQQTIGPAANQ